MQPAVKRTLLCLTLVALWLGVHGPSFGQTATLEQPSTTPLPSAEQWRVQRIYVPADRPEDWPRDKSLHYLPMPAEEFENRLAQLRSAQEHPTHEAGEFVRSHYSATLSGDDLRGEFAWEFDHAGSQSSTVLLGDCGLALDDVRWTNDSAADRSAAANHAVVGNDQNGRLAAVVDRSGKIQGRWSLHGKHDSDGAVSFDLQLPNSPVNVLRLRLPADLTPTVDQGGAVAADSVEANQRLWQIELDGNHRAKLHISKQTAAAETINKTFVQQKLSYEFSDHGLEFNGEFKLDVLGTPLQQIKLLVDAPLTIVKVQCGGKELPMSSVSISSAAATNSSSGGKIGSGQNTSNEVVISLATPIQGLEQNLTITAIVPLVLSESRQLPLVLIENAEWQTGKARIVVPDSLVLDELSTDECCQTNLEVLPEASPGEAVNLAFFSERPGIHLSVSPRREQVHINQGTAVFLRANEGTGHYHGELSIERGELFTLQAEISPQWIIESVESMPSGMVADWSQQAARSRPGKLTLQLSSPLTPQQNMRLLITGRRRSAPWGETLRADDLAMLNFSDAVPRRKLIQVQAAEAFQLQLRGAGELNRLDPARLSATDAALVDEKPTDLVFVDDDSARNLAVSLIGKTPQYDADIQAQAFVGDDRLTETYRFVLSPQGREVSRFDVRFSQPRGTPLVWSIQGEPNATVTARRLTAEGESSQANWPGEVWEVSLPAPRATQFTLLATRSSPLADDAPPALASFIEAETQRGAIQIIAAGHSVPEVRSRRLKSIPVVAPAADEYATTLAAFRYDPEEDTLLTADPPLVIVRHGSSAQLPQAWIWQAELNSHFDRAGAEYRLVCHLENAGLDKIQFQSPPGAVLRSAWIDGQQTAELNSASAGLWRINLPSGMRFVTIELNYSDTEIQPGMIAEHAPMWPACDVPILSRRWIVGTPPGTELADVQIGSCHRLDVPWTRRLFGPLARAQSNAAAFSGDEPAGQSSRSLAVEPPQKRPEQVSVADNSSAIPPARPSVGLQSPWKTAAQNSFLSSAGWKFYHFDSVGNEDRIWIADEQSRAAWAWTSFLLAAAVRWWLGKRSLAVDVGLLGFAAVVTLTIPAPWTPLCAGVWLGLCCGRVVVWLTERMGNRAAEVPGQTASISSLSKVAAVSSAVCLIVVLAVHSLVHADETKSATARDDQPPPTLQVLIPVDHDGHATGGLYYLPETFHGDLLRATANLPGSPQYLLTRANYVAQGDATQNSKTNAALAGNWQADFAIESLRENAAVELPIGFEGTVVVPNSIKLDGKPVSFRADEQQQRLVIEVPHAGSHQLEITLRCTGNSGELNFAVPVVASAQIHLPPVSADQQLPVISSATGSSDPADQRIWLGPAARIESLSSAASAAQNVSPTAAFDIDELYWLHLQPNSIVVDARFHLNVHAGSVQQLHLLADSRWQPMPPAEMNSTAHPAPADAVAVAQVQLAANNPREFVIDLSRPVAGRATVNVSFRLDADSGIGHWQPVMTKVSGAQAGKQLWAVSVDPALDFALSAGGSRNNVTPEKFAAAWPTRETMPNAAWQPSAAQVPWQLSTWLRQPRLTTRYQLAAIADQNKMELRLAAEVTTTNGQAFQYRLQIPPQMEIDTVSVLEKNVVQPCRWSRSRPDLLSVFLASPADGPRELLVRGYLPVSAEGKFTLPAMQVEYSATDGFKSLIFRRPEVLVKVLNAAGSKTLPASEFAAAISDARQAALLQTGEEPSVAHTPASSGELAAVLQSENASAPVQLQIEKNQPQLQATEVTTLDRNADAWRATVDVDLQIESGVVDVLRFDLPANWTGPFEITPVLPQLVEDVPGQNRRQLVIRPTAPWQHDVRLQIKGPLTVAAGQRPSAPDVRLLGVLRQSRFFSLPRRLENQQLAWDTRGLVLWALPETAAATAPDPSAYRTYQLVSDRCRASLRSADRSSDNSQVRLVDVAWSWDASGDFCGVAAFDLEPAGASSCELQLPTGQHLVQAQLDAVPARLSLLGENHWNVWLGDNKLPRHLEIIFTGTQELSPGRALQLAAPTLVELPVECTLWSIWGPPEAGAAKVPGGVLVSPLRHQALRLEGVAALVDSATGLLIDESTEDLARWYIPWQRRFLAAQAQFVQTKSTETAADLVEAADAELSAVDQDQARLARRLNLSTAESEAADQPASGNAATVTQPIVASDWLHLEAQELAGHRNVVLASARGQDGPLIVEYPEFAANNWAWRWTAAACVLMATIFLLLAWQLGWLIEPKLLHGPQLLGLAMGVVWLAWLTPCLLGLALFAVSLYGLWQNRAFGPA